MSFDKPREVIRWGNLHLCYEIENATAVWGIRLAVDIGAIPEKFSRFCYLIGVFKLGSV